jgi:heptaprenyl diphosphate synthase
MQSPNNRAPSEITAKTVLFLLAVGINALEYLFPRIPFLPWLKPGLANAITIVWIIRWGAPDAILFTVLRSWITSFYFGFSLVTLLLSLSGGVVAAAGMGVIWTLFGRRRWLGLIGLGVAGAALHNCGQLAAVYYLLTATTALWYQIPFMLAASLLFGAITGLFAHAALPLIRNDRREDDADEAVQFTGATTGRRLRRIGGGCVLLCAGVAVAWLRAPMLLGVVALATTAAVIGAAGGNLRSALYPVSRFWLLFLFVAVMDVFFSYGHSAFGVSFVTREGLHETAVQWLRLWTWIELSTILGRIGFNRIVLETAVRRLPFGRATLAASLLALELFPAVFELVRKRPNIDLRAALHTPKRLLVRRVMMLHADIVTLVAKQQEKRPEKETAA